MSLLDPSRPAGPEEAARALETLVLKQLVQATGLFSGDGTPGAGLRADLFADALAEAVTASGGIGLGPLVGGSLPPTPNAIPTAATASAASPGGVAPDLQGLVSGPSRLTSRYGERADPFTGKPAFHGGVDLAAPEGAPIHAAADGVVVRASERNGYGLAVEIDHGGGLHTLYAHASQLLVHEGERVVAGQTIADVGQTGRATGDHLHFEVRVDGHPVDPARALKAYTRRVEEEGVRKPHQWRQP